MTAIKKQKQMKAPLYLGVLFFVNYSLALRFLQLHELTANKRVIVPILSGIACILMFINAYISHKKIILA